MLRRDRFTCFSRRASQARGARQTPHAVTVGPSASLLRSRGVSFGETAAACSSTRPGRRSGLSEQVPPLRLQWRRRRDHRDVDELVADRAVDEVELHGRLYGGDEELLVAHCLGVFRKPRISGHVNRVPDDSRATHSGVRGAAWVRKSGSSDPTFRLIGVRYAESVSAAGQAAKAAAGRFGGRSLAETLTLSNKFTLETSSRWMCELAHLAPSCLRKQVLRLVGHRDGQVDDLTVREIALRRIGGRVGLPQVRPAVVISELSLPPAAPRGSPGCPDAESLWLWPPRSWRGSPTLGACGRRAQRPHVPECQGTIRG